MSALYREERNAKQEIAAILADFPELFGDDDLKRDMLEGETSFVEVIKMALDEEAEAAAKQKAIEVRIADLTAREVRFAKHADDARAAIRRLMLHAEAKKLEVPEATMSIRDGLASVDVYAPEELPQGFTRTKIEPDRAAIKAALLAGEDVPGAKLTYGAPILSIRRT